MPAPMPAVFVGHGNPMNALADNVYTRAWNALRAAIPRPTAVLCVSAHWYLPGTAATVMEQPPTIHDFGGFPKELHEFDYPAPGDPALAGRVRALLAPASVALDAEWGLDHGAWSVLCHLYPQADVPVVQLRIDETRPPRHHYDLGRRLSPLRDEGVLILGSGNLVHNLHAYAWGRHDVAPFAWAVSFEKRARDWLQQGRHEPLIDYEGLGEDALLSAPTPDHYLPLLYVMGCARKDDDVSFPVQGFDGGSVSMLTVRFG